MSSTPLPTKQTQSQPNTLEPSLLSNIQFPTNSAIPSKLNQIPTDVPTLVCNNLIVTQPLPAPHHMQTRSKNDIFKPKITYAAQVDYTTIEPASYSHASKHNQWCIAIDEEFQALQKQGTWSLVPMLATKNVMGCKWVYKPKHNNDGTITRYKARLVAKGFH